MISTNNSLLTLLYRYKIFDRLSLREFQKSSAIFKKDVNVTEDIRNDLLKELKPPLSDEEIEKMRNKSRIPERIYRMFIKKEVLPLENEYDFTMSRLRKYYARHGKASKLNPGIMWPTREEILETIKYEKIFEPPLQETLKKLEEARLAEEKRKQEVEAEVDKRMANLDKSIAEYYDRIEKKNEEVEKLRAKRQQLVEEISEYLGYPIDPKDPRFQEAVDQREREKKKALKIKKQEESYEKMLAKLKKMAESTEN